MYLEHVNLTVASVERSVDFYCRMFGFHVRWRGKTSDGQEAAHVGDERCYLALFEAVKPGRADADYDAVGLNHFGFVVDSLDAAKRRLRELGVEPHHEADYEPGQRLYFMDPDGIEVELVQYEAAVV